MGKKAYIEIQQRKRQCESLILDEYTSYQASKPCRDRRAIDGWCELLLLGDDLKAIHTASVKPRTIRKPKSALWFLTRAMKQTTAPQRVTTSGNMMAGRTRVMTTLAGICKLMDG